MAGSRPFILSLIMAILGIFLILGFVFTFITINNPSSDIFDEEYGLNDSITTMQASMDSFVNITNTAKATFDKAKPSPLDYVFLIFYEAFEIPKALFVFIFGGITSLQGIYFNILQGSVGALWPASAGVLAMVSVIITAGLILTGIFLLIRTIRSGESER